MKNILIVTSIALSALSFSSTALADDDSGFYLGLGVHRANFDRGAVASSDTKGNVSAGYMLNNNWGVDGTLYNFVNEKKDNVEVNIGGFALTGVYKIPVTHSVDVFAKAGIIHTGIEIKENNRKIADDSGNDIIVGLGAKLDYGNHNLILEYAKVDPKDASLDVLSLGYRYEF